jgi:hypothetical protein
MKAKNCLEAELLEEPLVFTSLVLFFQELANFLLGFLLGGGILQSFNVDGSGHFSFEGVTSGHDVAVVDDLHEGLDVGAAGNALSTHGLGNLHGSTLDTDNQGTTESLVGGLFAIIEM